MGTIAEDGLMHPFDQTTGLTKGFAFVNFLNPQDAKQAAATLNGWQLDKSHNIKVPPNIYCSNLIPLRIPSSAGCESTHIVRRVPVHEAVAVLSYRACAYLDASIT